MNDIFKTAAEVRVLVGSLAEQHGGWFVSQFFGPRATAFLSPVFARTTFQAQCQGVTAAAARLHDESIGIGRTYHLFRLPEVLEQAVAAALADAQTAEAIQRHLGSPTASFDRLKQLAAPAAAAEGPIALTGDFSEGPASLLQTMAGIYLDALQKGIKAFPFIRGA